jgi:hypothetical protein
VIFRRCTGTRTALFICQKAYGKAFFAYRMPFVLRKLKRCDDFHFDEDVLRQSLDSNAGACRLFGEILAVDGVERGEIAHIGEEAGGLHGVFKRGTGFFEDGGEVLHDLLCLLGDVCTVDVARCGVDRNLTGGEEHIAANDGLRIRADGCGGFLCIDFLQHDITSFRHTASRRVYIHHSDFWRFRQVLLFTRQGHRMLRCIFRNRPP